MTVRERIVCPIVMTKCPRLLRLDLRLHAFVEYTKRGILVIGNIQRDNSRPCVKQGDRERVILKAHFVATGVKCATAALVTCIQFAIKDVAPAYTSFAFASDTWRDGQTNR